VIRPLRRTYVVVVRLTDELLCGGNKWGLDLRRRAFPPVEQVSAEWSRCPGSMARRARDSVAPLRRSLAGWMPARMGRLSAGVGRKHPVTIRKASLMVGSMRWVWALRHQTGAQYSAVECLKSATRDVSFLRSGSRCRQPMTHKTQQQHLHLTLPAIFHLGWNIFRSDASFQRNVLFTTGKFKQEMYVVMAYTCLKVLQQFSPVCVQQHFVRLDAFLSWTQLKSWEKNELRHPMCSNPAMSPGRVSLQKTCSLFLCKAWKPSSQRRWRLENISVLAKSTTMLHSGRERRRHGLCWHTQEECAPVRTGYRAAWQSINQLYFYAWYKTLHFSRKRMQRLAKRLRGRQVTVGPTSQRNLKRTKKDNQRAWLM